MPHVNLFILGAAKAGTTALFKALDRCAEVSTPIAKEPNYFSRGCSRVPGLGPRDSYCTLAIRDKNEYEKNYYNKGYGVARYTADFSVSYLYDDAAPVLIKEYCPSAKFIVVLRDRVDRAKSHHLHLVRDMREFLSFGDALYQEHDRISKGWQFSWHYREMGMYGSQVCRYLEHFAEDQFLFIRYDDLIKSPHNEAVRVEDFLNLERGEVAGLDDRSSNRGGVPRNKTLAAIINRPSFFQKTAKVVLPRRAGAAIKQAVRNWNIQQGVGPEYRSEDVDRLHEYYSKDIETLYNAIGVAI